MLSPKYVYEVSARSDGSYNTTIETAGYFESSAEAIGELGTLKNPIEVLTFAKEFDDIDKVVFTVDQWLIGGFETKRNSFWEVEFVRDIDGWHTSYKGDPRN